MVEEPQKKAIHILMLEDSALDAELATARLQKANLAADVTLARTRAEFEESLLARPYDLILADYALPDFDGISALAMARDMLPRTPFIFISGRVGEEVAIDTLQRGATDYVLKHRLERLVPAVLRALKEKDEHATRMQAEAMFRQSELRFRDVIDAVPQMIWVATPDGRLAYSNQLWTDNVIDSLERWCDPAILHPQDYPACAQAWERGLQRGEAFTLEARLLRRSDQSYRWHILNLTPMAVDPQGPSDQVINWLGNATDIQDRKRNEEALRTAEKLSVTGRMAAAIAHEINNPLESLTNLLYLVRLECAGMPRALPYLDMADDELARISSITKQTLQFYRDPSMPVDVDARAIIEDVQRLFATRMRAKGIEVSIDVPPHIVFQAILGEIRQVLVNLVNNAIDAVQKGGHIEISARAVDFDDQPSVMIQVCDDGSGITEDQAQRLFEPFFSTKGSHGTGLGLWVSKGIVEKHGGRLKLSSSLTESPDTPNVTKAVVILPLKVVADLQQPSGKSS